MKLKLNLWFRAAKWIGIGLSTAALAWIACAQSIGTTTIQGTVYLANGTPGSGTLLLSWPTFTTADSKAVAAGRTTVKIGQDGSLSVNLATNLGSSPAGLYYTAVYHMSDGTTSTEYWVIPPGNQVSIAQVRAQVMPAAQAVQTVSKAYVDQAIQSVNQGSLISTGGTMTGPLAFSDISSLTTTRANLHILEVNVLDYGAVSDALSTVDGAMASGSITLTSASGLFTPSSVGKTISVQAAGGTGGSQQPLVTTVAAYISPTQLTLAAPATQTVSGMGVIWGTDNYTAFSNWAAALPGNHGIIPRGNFLINLAQSTRTINLGSNENITMDRSGTLYYVGNGVGALFGALFTFAPSAHNVRLDGLHIVGEWQNTASKLGNSPGGDYGGAIRFPNEGGYIHDVQIENSIISNIFGMGIGDWDNTDYNISVTHNTLTSLGDCAFTINTSDTDVSHNYVANSVCGMEMAGQQSIYSFNTFENDGGQYIIAVGGNTGGSPVTGTRVIGNMIINPTSTATGCISIGDSFAYGEIADNVCVGISGNGTIGLIAHYGGYVHNDFNEIHNNIFKGDGTQSHLCIYITGVTGYKVRNNSCSGFYGAGYFEGATNIESTGNTWDGFGPYDMALASGATVRMRDTLAHGTYNPNDYGALSSFTADSVLYLPTETRHFGPVNLNGTNVPLLLNGSSGIAGQMVTSAGPRATPTWSTPTTGGSLTGDNTWSGAQTYNGATTFNANATFNTLGANGLATLNGGIRISNGHQYNLIGTASYITLQDASGGFNAWYVDGNGTFRTYGQYLPYVIFSAAGTPVPTCNAAAKGMTVTVSDALNPAFDGTYTSGGAVTVPVICDGGAWHTVGTAISQITPLKGTTGSIGGSALTAGNCASGTATVTGATTSMSVSATPVTYPGDAFDWKAYVSASNTVTVKVCTNLAAGGTPAASAYNVRVIQ